MIPKKNRGWVFRRGSGDAGVGDDAEEEIRFHLETRIEDLKREGMTPQEADLTARAEFGDVERVRQELQRLEGRRAARRRKEEIVRSVFTDVRIAMRSLRRRPAFTAVVVLTLAVAIGGSTTIFSAVDTLLLRPLPFPESKELVQLTLVMPRTGDRGREERSWSYLKFRALMEAQGFLEAGAIYRAEDRSLTQVPDPELVRVESVSADYFPLLGIPVGWGRFFSPEEDEIPGRDFVTVISHELWQHRYDGDPGILGETVHLNHQAYTVIGVAGPGFKGLSAGVDLWVPTMTEQGALLGASIHTFHAVGRLGEDDSLEQTRRDTSRLAEIVAQIDPWSRTMDIRVRSLAELRLGKRLSQALIILLFAVGLVHLIACVNLANLLLARTAGRSREISIRVALGARQGRILRQLLTESLVLALFGAGIGLSLAAWATGRLRQIGLRPQSFMGQTEAGLTNLGFQQVGLDLRTVAFAVSLTLLTALLFGLLPAVQASKSDLNTTLKLRGWERRRTRSGRRTLPLPQALVAAQVALALVLLVGSGLLLRSLTQLLSTDRGYDGGQVLSASVQLPRDQYGDFSSYGSERSAQFLKDLVERTSRIPSVQASGLARCVPLASSCPGSRVILPDQPVVEPGTEPTMRINMVEGDFFRALTIPLERGRSFLSTDDEESTPVIVVNRTAAERLWPEENPLGRSLDVSGWFGPSTVVGVVADVQYGQIDSPAEPMVYVPFAQSPAMGGTLVIKGRGDLRPLVAALKTHLREMDPDLPLADVKTMSEWTSEASFTSRFGTLLLGLFAAMALLLSTMGVYGVLSVVWTRRTREVGVRMALGARGENVLSLVLREAAHMVMPGVLAGLVLALLLSRVLETLLYGVSPWDPATFLGGTLFLVLTGALASLFPAFRAIRVNPVETLNAE